LNRTIYLNASLAVFNLLPFPPLDGSKILETFLPASMQPLFEVVERYGIYFLMAALYLGVFGYIFAPVRYMIDYILAF